MADKSEVEKEESSDNNSEEELSIEEDPSKDANDDDDAKMDVGTQPPTLQPADNQENNGQGREQNPPPGDRQPPHDPEDELEDEFEDDGDNFPDCYPLNPPVVDQLPEIEYPADAPRSTPSERNLDFERTVRNNFVPFSKGLKGDMYRRRTNYEHQKIMG